MAGTGGARAGARAHAFKVMRRRQAAIDLHEQRTRALPHAPPPPSPPLRMHTHTHTQRHTVLSCRSRASPRFRLIASHAAGTRHASIVSHRYTRAHTHTRTHAHVRTHTHTQSTPSTHTALHWAHTALHATPPSHLRLRPHVRSPAKRAYTLTPTRAHAHARACLSQASAETDKPQPAQRASRPRLGPGTSQPVRPARPGCGIYAPPALICPSLPSLLSTHLYLRSRPRPYAQTTQKRISPLHISLDPTTTW